MKNKASIYKKGFEPKENHKNRPLIIIWFIATSYICFKSAYHFDSAGASTYARASILAMPFIPSMIGYILFSRREGKGREQDIYAILGVGVAAIIFAPFYGLLLVITYCALIFIF